MSTTTQPFTLVEPTPKRDLRGLIGLAVIVIGALAFMLLHPDPVVFPPSWNLHLRDPIDSFQSWVIGHRATHPLFVYFFNPFSAFIDARLRTLETFLLNLPWPVLLVTLVAVAYKAAGRRVAMLTLVSLLIMALFGLWKQSMATFALMGVAVFIALLIGIPLGILSARSPRFELVLRPVLDAMQTIPAFVYLIPVVLFFGIARVPSVIATVIYALPPAIRLTSLGIRQVAANTTEAADAFGSTSWQKLVKVQLPLALPSILLGINQTIMMALGIVVIAALIGAGGLGLEVLTALRNLQVGKALEAGIAIVLIAVIFDRISYGLSQESRDAIHHAAQTRAKQGQTKFSPRQANLLYWGGVIVVILLLVIADRTLLDLSTFPWRFSIRQPIDALVLWMRNNLYQIGDLPLGTGPFSDAMIRYLLTPLRDLLLIYLPWPMIVLGFAWLAFQAAGWRLAIFSALAILCLGLLGMWEQSMDTLSQVLVAVILAVVIGVPVGIGAARAPRFALIVRPVLDFLQTIPPFVYLVPVIMLFNIGRVPGIIASVLYAIPPIIRLTDLGIRQVAPNALEAADAFGSTSRQKLFKVELPLALPSIMLGVNQTVMMVLSMVIIAGLVGGGALGFEAVNGLAKSQMGRGLEAGLAILLLAMVLDRITQAWAVGEGK
ncbi:MAG: ABC transporter permease subunit [Chloroflexi bacterium]|nr:ABC transporter permease subunit [Chloroflexota bacterium]